jgi:ELWxxDGT repeat protein
VNNVFAVGERVAFTAIVGDWRSLWVHDRATVTTEPLWPELALEPEDDIHGVYPVNGGVIAVIRSDVNGYTLFRTDGTREGTFTLAHAASRFANRILSLGSFAGKAYFNRIGGDGTYGLWETDGSLAGTHHVWGGQAEQHVTDLGITSRGGIFFTNHNNKTVHYLAPGDTVPISLGARPNSAGYADRMIVLGDQVLVEASNGETNSTGRELWIADREAGSLRQIRDFLPGEDSGLFEVEFGRFREEVVLSATTPEHGREPWLTDGTPEGTRLLSDVNPGSEGSAPLRFVESAGLLYFSARDAIHGQELWVSDGTGAGTRLVADINPGKRDGAPHSLRPFRDGVLFTSQHPDYGEEIWFSDGTKEGTRIVLDCMPGPEGRGDFGALIVGDRAIFSATHPQFGRVLWESDGSATGTRPLFERLDGKRAVVTEPAGWKVVGDKAFLTVTTPEHGAELWATDLNSGESKIVCDIHRGPEGSNPQNFIELDSRLYFTADDGVHGVELWSSDGKAENTKMVHDAWNGKGSGNPRYIVQWDEKRFAFVAFNGVENGIYSFHVPPGFPTYCGKPSNLRSAWDPSNLSPNIDGWLYFSNQTNSGETTAWRTDGTHVERVPGLGRDNMSN